MTQLEKKLTLYGLCSIAIGSSIGSGIFVTPAATIKQMPHGFWALLPWILGGIASLCGALTFAELGSKFPRSGGIYVYLKEAYGSLFGFLYGWVILMVINTGALAALTMVFVDYLGFFIKLSSEQKQIIAVAIIVILSIINIRGVKYSQTMASTFTTLKLLAILFIICAGGYYLFNNATLFTQNINAATPQNIPYATVMAFIGVFWSFGGWHHISYLSDEIVDVQKLLPRALLISILVITLVYMLIILSYETMLPLAQIAASERVAGDALAAVMPFGGKLVAIFIAISVFGTIAIYTMTAPRIYYAMAKDGIFFKQLANVHPTFKTPHIAIIAQSIWAIVLILIYGSFVKIITYVTFMDVLFMTLAAISIFIFRKRKSGEGNYRVVGYPFIPLVYIIIASAFVISTFVDLNRDALIGLGVTAVGLVFYYFFKKNSSVKTIES